MAIVRTKLTLTNSASQISRLHMYRTAKTILIFRMTFAILGASAATNELLVTTDAIRSLTAEQAARAIPVSITGVVTAADPSWGGSFFVQDSTAGIFVYTTDNSHPVPGDLVQVSGVSDPGEYTPDIVSPQWKKLGTAPLPEARLISTPRFMSGAEDGNRVEVSGAVKSVKPGMPLALEVESGGYNFQVFPTVNNDVDPNALVGETVHVKGTVATSYDVRNKRLLSVAIFTPLTSDLIVDSLPGAVISNGVLTAAVEILSLTSSEAAQKISVSVTGVVTVAEPNWGGDFFLQDSSGGVFVNNRSTPQPALGDLVQVSGFSNPGSYAPDINSSGLKKLGTATLPPAVPISAERFMSGAADGERVELSGVVRSAEPSQLVKTRLRVELESGGFRFRAFPPLPANFNPQSLVGATVRVRGTAAASFNPLLRKMLTVVIFVPQESDFIVDQPPDPAISEAPLTSLNQIAQYRRNNFPDPRIRVRGVVISQRPGEDIFLHDGTGGLQVESRDTNIFAPGEMVEAVGFPDVEHFLPVLEDATLIRTSESQQPMVPQKVSIRELFTMGIHHADLISLEGILLDRSLRSSIAANSLTNTEDENVLTLKSDRYFFAVVAPNTGPFSGLTDIPIGTTLKVSGVCLLQADRDQKIQSVQVLPVSAADIRILQQPNWWTPQRLLIALGILLIVSLVGTVWMLMIHRKNAVLKVSMAEKIKAQEELQKANDQLETRVEERTKEWKFEMSARKEAEIQYKAILSERTRLAQELHDTLLQGFTGVGLKLDAVTSSLPPSLAATKEQIQKILKQSDEYLSEARRSVWQLRSPSLQAPEDFPDALKKVSERALQGTDISLRFTTCGTEFELEPGIEDDFLRICEEAVRNAARHANPTEVEVTLEYLSNELRLRIRDNGHGFDPNGSDSAKDGHFGLLGIRERTKRMAGNLSLTSQPGNGTEILVTVSSSFEF